MAKGGKEAASSKQADAWYGERKYMVIIGVVSLIAAFVLGSASLNSGAWWEYLLTLILLILAFNRFIAAVKND